MQIRYDIIKSHQSIFEVAAVELLQSAKKCGGVPVRLVFFTGAGMPYAQQRELLGRLTSETFTSNTPMVTLVAQKPLCCTYAVEIHFVQDTEGVCFEKQYVTLEDEGGKMLLTQGIRASREELTIGEQSDEIFEQIDAILKGNGYATTDIVRQWNYIEQITAQTQGGQNYQQFNDSRSEFYAKCTWEGGYPAATGIGADGGSGVVVELDACRGGEIRPIDNALQVAAHEYSKEVLLGTEVLSTPKFERAKQYDSVIYISGTAAIRGEESLEGVGVEKQTLTTLENIEELIFEGFSVSMFRAYLKHGEDYAKARKVLEERYPNVPTVYVVGDVCREELLIEIEGVALNL